MKKIFSVVVQGIGSLVLIAGLGPGCSDSALKSEGAGGSMASASGGTPGSGGASTLGLGGTAPSGGGGAVLGGNSGKGGTTGSGGTLGSDAGIGKDATTDVCLALACPLPLCPDGQVPVPQSCGCPICMPVDAGQPDAPVCPFGCPAVRCAYGSVRDACGCETCLPPDAGPEVGRTDAGSPKDAVTDACLQLPCAYPLCAAGYAVVDHVCGCPTCEPVVDAGASADTGKLACATLDECSCGATSGCAVISEACYCPYPKCNPNGACFCGGGKYLGCAPTDLTTCAAAKTRVASLCPTLKGAIFDGLCQQSDSACSTKCLDEVTSCSDIACSMCEACDCAGDAYSKCMGKCRTALAQ